MPDLVNPDTITCKFPLSQSKAYGSSVNLAPNKINFNTVWAKFKTLNDNALVFSVVISTVILYFIMLVIARRADKLDKLKASPF